MKRPLAALVVTVALATGAEAKFGISKTKVTLKRTRPPEIVLLGETVTVEVAGRARAVTDRQLDSIRQRVEDALSADASRRLVTKGADSVVRVSVDDFEARVNDNVIYETHYVKIGERQEWDAKKKQNVTKDVYGNKSEPVRVRTARGRIGAHVEVATPSGPHTADAGAGYQDEFKGEVRIPEQASSESSLEHYLVELAGRHAAATVTFSPDPVEALLAVDGDLKDGNRLAQGGLWREALGNWVDRKPFKGDKEAARMHNIGVAHEALAYALPIDGPEHRAELAQAQDFYKKALALDPGEKYFAEPMQRIEVSLQYAANAQRYTDETRQWREGRDKRGASRAARQAEAPPAAAPPAAAAPTAPVTPRTRPPATAPRKDPAPVAAKAPAQAPVQGGLASSAGVALPLRNGSFESGLDPWAVTGKGVVASDARRGRIFQAAATTSVTTLVQPIGVDVQTSGAATLSLAYKVAAGEGQVRVVVAYDDANGRPRTSTLEVTAGDPPGDWTPWTGNLLALRPRAARLKEIRIVAEGGTVLLDNVALTVR
ncbi:MAG TPA: hypothetical protein VIK51_00430 [Vicinamibacteria bacterium]